MTAAQTNERARMPGPRSPSDPDDAELRRLFDLRHRNPHSILGAHRVPRGVALRVWRPDAEEVTAVAADGESQTLRRRGEEGLFEGLFEGKEEVFRYRLWIRRRGGETIGTPDPFSFLPTLTDADLYYFLEGRDEQVPRKLGARPREVDGASGTAFAVWAPNAEGVSVVGSFNHWDGRIHPMRMLGATGVWEIFIPDVRPGALYKFEMHGEDRQLFLKTDPYARAMEAPPATASIVHESAYSWGDEAWRTGDAARNPWAKPVSIYEVHLGSWRRVPEEGDRPLRYREIAPLLCEYALDLGFTHVELLPVMEHPYGPSWGYQVGGYFAPTARYGTPDDFRYFVDYCHRRGLGVLLDWVPAHFPKDAELLGRFDGTALYEHADPRQGEHPDWNTYIFNYGRHEVRNFLLASALYWLEEFHADGLRLDAVASMLYLDYSRQHGEWIPNRYGGRENLEAIAFLRELNERVYARFPDALMVAEESTAWGGVSRPTSAGGLGFGFKWNMGWMHDTLYYFSRDPIYRRHLHGMLTFSLLYAWHENFILPLSHDEVVHGKRSLLQQMPGSPEEKFAHLRALYGYMWAHPGKKLLFMGGEFGQFDEWYHARSLDWHLLEHPGHRGLQALVRDLNRLYRREPALWERDFDPSGFEWVDCHNADENVIAFLRHGGGRSMLCVCNLSPVLRSGYRVGLPKPGVYRELLNTDSLAYGGTNAGNAGAIVAEEVPWHGRPYSARAVLPPLSAVWFEAPV